MRRNIKLILLTMLILPCALAAAGEPKGGDASAKQKDQLVFIRSTDKGTDNLWIWTEGEKPRALTAEKGVGRFAISHNPLFIIYQVPFGASEPYRPYALSGIKINLDKPARPDTESFDRPAANRSDLNPILSPDGRLLVFNRVNLEKYGKSDYDSGVWACRMENGCSKPFLFWKSPQKHPGVIHVPTAFSPDSSKLAIQRTSFAAGDIGDTLIIETKRRTTLNTFLRSRVETWSPSGSKMLVSKIDTETGCRLLYLGNEDEEKWKLLTQDNVSDGEPAFSPDGRRIAVHSREQLGDSIGIWIIDAVTGQRERLTDSGSSPQWTKDGKRLYFRRRDESTDWTPEIWFADPSGGDAKIALKNSGRFRIINGAPGAISDEGGI